MTDSIVDEFKTLLALDKERESALNDLFFGENGVWDRFVKAPASAKYHNNFPGGLIQHSVAVTKLMVCTAKAWKAEIPLGSLTTCGLLHDLGKIGNEYTPMYIPTTEAWKKKRGINYDYGEDIFTLPHCARSIFILMQHRFPLNEEEFQAILYHDGLYIPMGKSIMHNETLLMWILHTADKKMQLEEE